MTLHIYSHSVTGGSFNHSHTFTLGNWGLGRHLDRLTLFWKPSCSSQPCRYKGSVWLQDREHLPLFIFNMTDKGELQVSMKDRSPKATAFDLIHCVVAARAALLPRYLTPYPGRSHLKSICRGVLILLCCIVKTILLDGPLSIQLKDPAAETCWKL